MDRYGVTVEIVGADVLDLLSGLDVHISVRLSEGVGEVGRALICEPDTVNRIGNIYVVDEVFFTET